MMGGRMATLLLVALWGIAGSAATEALPVPEGSQVPGAAPAIRIEFFYTEGCATCARVEAEILPQLEAMFGGLYRLDRVDIDVDTNYLRLAAYQERLAIDDRATSVLVVNRTRAYADWAQIHGGFLDDLGRIVSGAIETSVTAPDTHGEALSLDDLDRRARRFTVAGVALAGLIDGVNPCAISTLVFFISILGVMKVRGSRLALIGALFCITSFVTYIAIGFGLFRLLYLFAGFRSMRRGLELGMAVLLLVLAILSLRDALRYRAGGQAGDITLKLPRRVSEAIHNVIRGGLSTRRILWGSVAAAFLVTVLESVCTGQVYVPTLVLVLRHGQSVPLVIALLLLYNAMFILPLIVALGFAYHGTRTERFVHWSRAHVVPSKLALAALFVALAALIAIL
jgi:hypothetical protein